MSRSQALHKLMIVISLLFILLVSFHLRAETLHHKMNVEVHPSLKMLKVQDTLTFPKGSSRKLSFLLHRDLHVSLTSADDSLTLIHPASAQSPYAEYGLTLGNQDNKVSLSYYGVIYDPVTNEESTGLITPEGATLFGRTYWYPFFLDTLTNFEITVQTPADWRSLAQGQITNTQVEKELRTSQYVEIYPQEEIYLIAGPFSQYEIEGKNGKKIQVLLRKPESALAQSFLSLADDYLNYYSELIAPYPYSSFTVVENFWETGYGMPSFTLLGPKVIRLPFILNSSLPHEVLHNWWGNSVYIDYDKGNWSEGLTTYMADYWQQEKNGNDRNVRLNALISFSDFVAANPEKDFPLRQFKERHNSSSEAIGYGKSMMLFHMLEFRFGRDLFSHALQNFYIENQFQKASFSEIQKSFEKLSNQNLDTFFTQWLDFTGAPNIELADINIMHWHEGSYSLTYTLKQKQQVPFDLAIPVIWDLESGEQIHQLAHLTGLTETFSLVTKKKPTKISVDPDYHVFRNVYPEERPMTLSTVFGNSDVNFYFSQDSSNAENFARVWASSIEGKSSFNKISAQDFKPATKGAIVFVGDHDAFSSFMKIQLQDQKFALTEKTMTIEGQEFNLDENSTVLATRLKNNPEQPIVWVRWSKDNNPEEWASRLLHYGSFGVLVFKGRPAVLKSSWPALQSPLQKKF
ncbi:MAG: M1 family metallopeptidase [Bdellovibrio sp.]